MSSLSTITKPSFFPQKLGGKIIVTGIGKVDEDEFMLTLLNDQVLYLTTFIIEIQIVTVTYFLS